MKYRGVCDTEGIEMIAACKLSMFCSGHGGKSDIVLAKPRGMLGRDTAVFSNESHRSPHTQILEIIIAAAIFFIMNNMYTSLRAMSIAR